MSWQIRLVEPDKYPKEVGDAWYASDLLEGELRDHYLASYLSAQYKRDWLGKRPPLFVKFPCGESCCIDSRYFSKDRANPTGEGWTVTGEPPNLTLSPSIYLVGRYHGWIRNGVISDDCEGRTFRERR